MAGEVGETSAARKLSTATSILARTYRQQSRKGRNSVTTKFPNRSKVYEEMSEERVANLSRRENVSGAEAAVGTEQRRRCHVRRCRLRHR
jgi:hypothetical protein